MAEIRKESDLYIPVKALLTGQGYEVKGEIGSADLVAVRINEAGEEEEPVIVELKTGFTLSLFHQAIERQKITDAVYIAVPHKTGRAAYKTLLANKTLCRRLGLGLITVRLKDGFSEIHLDPAPYKPRKTKPRKTRLLREFHARVGDPNIGGVTKTKIMTAYRQDAIRCLYFLHDNGATKAAIVAKQTGVERARNIMAADHYGWFEPAQGLGFYQITPKGKKAIKEYAKEYAALEPEGLKQESGVL